MDPLACNLSVTDHFLCCQLIFLLQKGGNVYFHIERGEYVLHIETFVRHDRVTGVTSLWQVSSLDENAVTGRPSICRRHIGHQSSRSDSYEDFQRVTIFVSLVRHLLGCLFSRFLYRKFYAIYDHPGARIQAFEITRHVLINQFLVWPDV